MKLDRNNGFWLKTMQRMIFDACYFRKILSKPSKKIWNTIQMVGNGNLNITKENEYCIHLDDHQKEEMRNNNMNLSMLSQSERHSSIDLTFSTGILMTFKLLGY